MLPWMNNLFYMRRNYFQLPDRQCFEDRVHQEAVPSVNTDSNFPGSMLCPGFGGFSQTLNSLPWCYLGKG